MFVSYFYKMFILLLKVFFFFVKNVNRIFQNCSTFILKIVHCVLKKMLNTFKKKLVMYFKIMYHVLLQSVQRVLKKKFTV